MTAAGRFRRLGSLLISPVLVAPVLGMLLAHPAHADPPLKQQLLRLTNQARANAGCAALRLNPVLNRIGTGHAADMATRDFFSHTGSDGQGPVDRARRAGYPGGYIGENLAAGNATATGTFRQWMTSPGHRHNILTCSFTELGVGYASSDTSTYRHYWSQELGRPG